MDRHAAIQLVGGDSPLDFGYRLSSGVERFNAHAVFMNANFTFKPQSRQKAPPMTL